MAVPALGIGGSLGWHFLKARQMDEKGWQNFKLLLMMQRRHFMTLHRQQNCLRPAMVMASRTHSGVPVPLAADWCIYI